MVGRLFLKFVPWWVLAFMGLSMLPVFGIVVQDELDRRGAWKTLIETPQPAPLPLADLPRHGARDTEVHVTARWSKAEEIAEISKDGVNYAYTVLRPNAETGPLLALSFEAYRDSTVRQFLNDSVDDDGRVTLGGLREHSVIRRGEITRDLAARGIRTSFVVIDPYLGNRQAMLESKLSGSWLVLGIIAAFEVAILGAAFVKFRRWRHRRAGALPKVRRPVRQQPAQPPKPKREIRSASATVTAKKTADPFADSPIQTRKGWFR